MKVFSIAFYLRLTPWSPSVSSQVLTPPAPQSLSLPQKEARGSASAELVTDENLLVFLKNQFERKSEDRYLLDFLKCQFGTTADLYLKTYLVVTHDNFLKQTFPVKNVWIFEDPQLNSFLHNFFIQKESELMN